MKRILTVFVITGVIALMGIGCSHKDKEHLNQEKVTVTLKPRDAVNNIGQTTDKPANSPDVDPGNVDVTVTNSPAQGASKEDFYNQAKYLIKQKRYPQALGMLSGIRDYKNSKDIMDQLRYIMNASFLTTNKRAIAAITKDGKVLIGYNGKDASKFDSVASWNNMRVIHFLNDDFIVGMQDEGKVSTNKEYSNTQDQSPYIGIEKTIFSWNNMKLLQSDYPNSVMALDYYGDTFYSRVLDSGYVDGTVPLEGWNHLVDVVDGKKFIAGLKEDGTVITKLYMEPSILEKWDTSDWKNIVQIAGGKSLYGLKEDGTVVGTGCSESVKDVLKGWKDIIAISANSEIILGLKRDGTVLTTSNSMGGPKAVEEWTGIVAVKAGFNFSLGLKADGTLVMVGDCEGSGIKTPDPSLMKNLYVPEMEFGDVPAIVHVPGKSDNVSHISDGQDAHTVGGKNLVVEYLHVTNKYEIHLSGYESFVDFNQEQFFSGFQISEEWVDFKPYYKFTSKAMVLYVNANGSNWYVNHVNGKKLEFAGRLCIPGVDGATIPEYIDCLSTGKPQLILKDESGSEMFHIYDTDTLKEYEIENYMNKLEEYLSSRLPKEMNENLSLGNMNFIIKTKGKLYVCYQAYDRDLVLGDITGQLVLSGKKIVLKQNTLHFNEYESIR